MELKTGQNNLVEMFSRGTKYLVYSIRRGQGGEDHCVTFFEMRCATLKTQVQVQPISKFSIS